MLDKNTNHRSELIAEMQQFIQNFSSVQIATADKHNQPEASYAPTLFANGGFYLYLSHLAKHSRNLQQNPLASLLFIESEDKSVDIFERQRASFSCEVTIISRDSQQWQTVLELMQQQHGATVEMIRPLTDFTLYFCQPQHINFVKGFAQAYRFNAQEWQQACNHSAHTA